MKSIQAGVKHYAVLQTRQLTIEDKIYPLISWYGISIKRLQGLLLCLLYRTSRPILSYIYVWFMIIYCPQVWLLECGNFVLLSITVDFTFLQRYCGANKIKQGVTRGNSTPSRQCEICLDIGVMVACLYIMMNDVITIYCYVRKMKRAKLAVTSMSRLRCDNLSPQWQSRQWRNTLKTWLTSRHVHLMFTVY